MENLPLLLMKIWRQSPITMKIVTTIMAMIMIITNTKYYLSKGDNIYKTQTYQ